LLIEKYNAYRKADERVAILTIRLEGVWLKTEIQIDFLRSIWHQLDQRLQSYQARCFDLLQDQLQTAKTRIENLTVPALEGIVPSFDATVKLRRSQKARFAALEGCLDKTIASLEDWHQKFDPSWFLTIRVSDAHVDREISKRSLHGQVEVSSLKAIRDVVRNSSSTSLATQSMFCDQARLTEERVPIASSAAFMSMTSQEYVVVILDTITYSAETDMITAKTHVRDLARLLATSEPSKLGLLKCLGVLPTEKASGKPYQFQFLFEVPARCENPRSLRCLLEQPHTPLDVKFELAKSLARSVMSVHTATFVHKNIRPESIIVFEQKNSRLPFPFLIGFERFRPAAAQTNLVGDMSWERNLYRHPRRQGILPEDMYIMQHDIYSLGVCLLEVGVWTSFVRPSEPPQPGPALDISDLIAMNNQRKAAHEIKQLLISMAATELPSRMGLTYTDIVMSCLTCLDPAESNVFSSDDLSDEDGIVVGVAFIEKVLMRLETISI